MGVSVLFTVIFLALLGLCLFCAWRRSWVRSVSSLGVTLAAFGGAYGLTRLLVSAWGGPFAEALKEIFLIAFGLKSEATVRETATYAAADAFVSVVLGVSTFLFLFGLLWLIFSGVKRLLFRKIAGVKYGVFTGAKRLPALSVLLALLSFGAASFAVLYPLGAASSAVHDAAARSAYPLSASVLTNPISRSYGVLGRGFFDSLTRPKEEVPYRISDEAEHGAALAMALRNLGEERGEDEANVALVTEALRGSHLLPDFLSEVAANAAANWKAGHSFLNMELEIPEGRSGELVRAALDTVTRWEAENLEQDLETGLRIYILLRAHGITSLEDDGPMLKALCEQDFSERLFLLLSGNPDFIELIPKIMRFGIGSALDAMHFEMKDEYIQEFDASSLTAEEWREEAGIFSRVLSQMGRMADGDPDLNALLKDLRALSGSKLLDNFITNLVIQILANLLSGFGS